MSNPTRPEELLELNAIYAKTHVPKPIYDAATFAANRPQRMVIITCLDNRLRPEENFGLVSVSVVRNAGGRAKNAIIDVSVLDTFIDVTHLVVIHHTNCGLTLTNDEKVKRALEERSPSELAKYEGNLNGLCFTEHEYHQSVQEDVLFLRNHPFVRKETKVLGFLYDITTGKLEPVEVESEV